MGIDLSLGTWRGIAGPKNLPPEVLAYLAGRVAQSDRRARLPRGSGEAVPGLSYADDKGFRDNMTRDAAVFTELVKTLPMKN